MKKLLPVVLGLLLSTAASAQKGVLIIDAGHGGADAGATAATGLTEKQLSLQLAGALQREATAAGYTVVMTREDDSAPSRAARAALRDRYQGSKAHFISLHADVSPSDTVKGLTIHYDARTAGLTTDWRRKLVNSLMPFGRIRTTSAGLAVLRGSDIPALSLAPGYFSSPDDLARISDPAFQEKVAKAVVASLD